MEYRKAVASPDVDTEWGDFESEVFAEALLEGDEVSASAGMHDSHGFRGGHDKHFFRWQATSFRGNITGANGITVPRGYCLSYNGGEACPRKPCPFKHVCPTCEKSHPKAKQVLLSSVKIAPAPNTTSFQLQSTSVGWHTSYKAMIHNLRLICYMDLFMGLLFPALLPHMTFPCLIIFLFCNMRNS